MNAAVHSSWVSIIPVDMHSGIVHEFISIHILVSATWLNASTTVESQEYVSIYTTVSFKNTSR